MCAGLGPQGGQGTRTVLKTGAVSQTPHAEDAEAERLGSATRACTHTAHTTYAHRHCKHSTYPPYGHTTHHIHTYHVHTPHTHTHHNTTYTRISHAHTHTTPLTHTHLLTEDQLETFRSISPENILRTPVLCPQGKLLLWPNHCVRRRKLWLEPEARSQSFVALQRYHGQCSFQEAELLFLQL